ncbi:MAG: transglutaminase domain-containing protein [Pseudomonadota bacterium]
MRIMTTKTIGCIAFIIVCLIGLGFLALNKFHASSKPPDHVRELRFTQSVTNPTAYPKKDEQMRLSLPLSHFHHQKILDVTIKQPLPWQHQETSQHHHGIIQLPTIPPFGQISATAHVRLGLWSQSRFVTQDHEPWLQASPWVPFTDSRIQHLASTLKHADSKKTIDKSFAWITTHIQQIAYKKKPMGALYALTQKRGDCTEMSFLMTALLRANQIPSRIVEGYIVTQHQVIHVANKHNWVEVLRDKQWHILDPTEKRRYPPLTDYVVMKILE